MSEAASRPLVLVVEDDELTRMDAMEMIRSAGYLALEAADADAAIALLESNPDISVVFTDIDMPHSNEGQLLAHAIRRRWPPVKVIATSGHFDMKGFVLPEGTLFLPKPYVLAMVTRTLQDAIAR